MALEHECALCLTRYFQNNHPNVSKTRHEIHNILCLSGVPNTIIQTNRKTKTDSNRWQINTHDDNITIRTTTRDV